MAENLSEPLKVRLVADRPALALSLDWFTLPASVVLGEKSESGTRTHRASGLYMARRTSERRALSLSERPSVVVYAGMNCERTTRETSLHTLSEDTLVA